jgi:hygromycin-B 7''-O-kinase
MCGKPQALQEFRALGPIPRERLQLAADRWGLGRVLSSEALGGMYGNNIGLHTESGDWVLRGVVPPLEPVMLRRERYFARLVHERASLASPWPYWIDESDTIFGWPCAIMPRLPGKVLHPAAKVQWSVIGRALGRATADLHGIILPRIGNWDAACDDIVSPNLSPAEWFAQRVRDLQQRVAETSSALDTASAALVDRLVSNALPNIGEFEPAYVHGDLGIGNFVGERRADGFEFTGVFDLAGGYAGDPDEDLATPLWWPFYWGNDEAPRAFLGSYRAEHPPRPGEMARARAYVVVSMLANWETGRRMKFGWYGECRTFREWALPLLEQVDAILRDYM